MSASVTIAHTIQGLDNPFTDSNVYTAGQGTILEETIVGGTNVTYSNFDVDVSECEFVLISCTRDITLTINDDGTPDATINVLAGKPVVWKNDGYFLNPLGTVDVTSLKATLAAGTDAVLRINVGQDPSP
jgi:hypothetical protein